MQTAGLFAALTVNTAAYAVLRHHSRGRLGERYSLLAALLAAEVAKWGVSAAGTAAGLLAAEEGGARRLLELARGSVVMVPAAAAYLAVNVLGFVALAHLDPGTFLVLSNLKLLATAGVSAARGRPVAPTQWAAVALISLGAVVVLAEYDRHLTDGDGRSGALFWAGVGACLGDVLVSSCVSVYLEVVFKQDAEEVSVLERNLQLSSWSIAAYAALWWATEGAAGGRLLDGWTALATACAAVAGFGGILVALVLRRLDAVVKTLATSAALVVAAVADGLLDGHPPTVTSACGAGVVMVAGWLYHAQQATVVPL
jgi:drug/metabolite transporter (DMT)-like permease